MPSKLSDQANEGRTALLVRLDAAIDQFPPALARAAQCILENPDKVVHQSLAELGDYAKVGQAQCGTALSGTRIRGLHAIQDCLVGGSGAPPRARGRPAPGRTGCSGANRRSAIGLHQGNARTARCRGPRARCGAGRRIDPYRPLRHGRFWHSRGAGRLPAAATGLSRERHARCRPGA